MGPTNRNPTIELIRPNGSGTGLYGTLVYPDTASYLAILHQEGRTHMTHLSGGLIEIKPIP